ncbi:MAG: protein kinase [Actinomycetota bacterium]
MNAADFQKIKDIFAAVSEAEPENRPQILREMCGTDSLLLKEVQSLISVHDEAENIIEKNAFNFDSLTNSGGKNYDGKQFGNYKILREIGRGGMGAVFLAERNDGEFHQIVALKIVRQTILDDETERHFRREREILASLNHPNIAQLHDGGVSERGEAFLAMEFVEGATLLEFADAHVLSTRERLQLFLKICAAVSYAHRNLTIHRDLKPSNILVTTGGEPKLLDFGLAKIIDENLSDQNQTATVFRAFTPAYAAPEQILGKNVTTAADVYSLGVVFYELLTGAKPFQFEGKSLEEIIQTITNSEPSAPSAITKFKFQISNAKETDLNRQSPIANRKLNSDIDNIALKALQKETERRYQSVEEFANDIERHLQGLPILARPATFLYRASKFFRRNKIAVSATVLVILSIITGLIFTLWQANETRKERDRAEKRFNDVRKLSNSLLFEITPRIERLQGSTEARELLVKRALEYLDSLAVESQKDATLQSELASAYEKIGELQGNQGKPNLNDFAGAVDSYEKAQKIRLNLSTSPENQRLLAENFRAISNAHYSQNDVKGSFNDSNEALKIYEKLVAENPQSFDLQIAFIQTQMENGFTYSDNNQYSVAIPIFQKVLDQLSKLDQSNRETKRLAAKAFSLLANALSWDNRQAEAEPEMNKSIEIIEDLLKKYPNDTNVRQTTLQIYFQASGIYEEIKNDIALKFAKKAMETATVAVETDSADLQAKLNLGRAFSRLGVCLVNVKQFSRSIFNLQKAETIFLQLKAQEPKNQVYQRDLAKLYVRFGDAERLNLDFRGALESYQKSADLFESIASTDDKNTLAPRDLAQSLKNVGELSLKLKETEKARRNYQRAFEILNNLKALNALGEADRKMFDDVQSALQKL